MFRLTPKRILIWVLLGGASYVGMQYIPVLFYAWEFNDFVRDEVRFAPLRETTEQAHLQDHILEQAKRYRLIIDRRNVRVTKTRDPHRGIEILAVEIDYRAPVDLYYMVHEVPFHIRASVFY
jgi:hypothetical protein